MAAKKPTVKITTPKAEFIWPKLDAPDMKFVKDPLNDFGRYSVKVRMPKDDPATEEFCARIQALWEEGYEEACAAAGKKKLNTEKDTLPFSDEEDEDGEPTGNIIVRFGLKAKVKRKDGTFFEQRPAVFDARGVLIPPPKIPGMFSGTIGRVTGEVNTFYTSKFLLSLKLRAAQIITVVNASSGSASDYGFGAEEGYAAEEDYDVPEQPETATPDDSGGDF